VNHLFRVGFVMCGVKFLSSTGSNERFRLAIIGFRKKIGRLETERLATETKNARFRINDHLF
jgi:hypothetical protein